MCMWRLTKEATLGAISMTVGVSVMVTMLAARNIWYPSLSMRPLFTAERASTKENSPICARLMAARMETRRGYPTSSMGGRDRMDFRKMSRAAKRNTLSRWCTRKPTSSSIPTEMKNRLVKTSLKGRMPSRTLRLYSDPESRSPARNAPRARERPSEAVPRAMAKHRPSTVMSMSSLLRVRSTSCMMRGTTWRRCPER